ncbi:hypothetical protein G3I27_29875, partial [Streptomyces sp. SID10692]|nr:hypothetical protein [Streptomyces sp. SID10692]
MGRHSRKGSAAIRPDEAARAGGEHVAADTASGTGRRRRNTPDGDRRDVFSPLTGDGRGPFTADAPQVRGGHPEQREPGGGWGAGPADPGRAYDAPA